MKLPPKHVKRANAFCVTERLGKTEMKGKVKDIQKVHFFGTEEEAMKFYNA